MRLSIVIPAYNEADAIEQCLEACLAQQPLANEIIVVNNNSTDETASLVKQLSLDRPHANIRLVDEAEQGIQPARNRGFHEATGDIIGRIDADTLLQPGWVKAVLDCFADPAVAASTGPVLYHDMPLKQLGLSVDDAIRASLHKSARDHRFLFGSNMAIRASTWRQVQDIILPDPEDCYHEDVSLAITLFQNDLNVAYEPQMVAGMSARRVDNSLLHYYRYVMRFERTFRAHGVTSTRSRIPIFIYLLIYFPTRTIRTFYDGKTNRFTLKKLRLALKRFSSATEQDQ